MIVTISPGLGPKILRRGAALAVASKPSIGGRLRRPTGGDPR